MPSEPYQVQLEMFEGPLDLLLHLIRQQEIDIFDIPIAQITDQYLHHLEMMKDLNITIAGEFLVMAATLIHIKSKMLLPPDPRQEDEEAEDPRQELVDQLIEHEKFKNAAQMLYERETIELSVWGRGGSEFEEDEKELVSVGLFDLVRTFHQIVERYKEKVVLQVEPESVTLEQKLLEIRQLLQIEKEFYLSSYIRRNLTRLHIVVTILALLELVKLQEIRLFQKRLFDDVRIVAR